MKISIEYDTVSKKGMVMMGDKKLDNVSSINLYGWDDEDNFGMEIRTVEGDEENKLTKVTSVYASEAGYQIDEKIEKEEIIESLGKLFSSIL